MIKNRHFVRSPQSGFTLVELMVVAAILLIVLAPIFNSIALMAKRSQTEEVKVDISQETREFVDEFERDIHQAGFPNCRMFYTGNACTSNASYTSAAIAAGLVSVSSTRIIFEGDVDGDGVVDSIQYRIVDSSGNYPPTGTCPCTIQRSQVVKVAGTSPLNQATTFSQELQNVVNSGQPAGGAVYGNGLNISGSTAWGATNTAYYASIATVKDFPVFTAYLQDGTSQALPLDISTASGQSTLPLIRSIRITINVLANQTTGTDLDSKARPFETLVGTGRLVNNTF